MIEVVRLEEKLAAFDDHWHPRIVADLNDHQVKLAKVKGEFVWHKHDDEDEMFFVLRGRLTIHLRDRVLELESGELCVIPRGVDHKPVALEETHIMLLEPKTTLNTGDADAGRPPRRIPARRAETLSARGSNAR